MMRKPFWSLVVILWAVCPWRALAGEADVLAVRATCDARSICRFAVTVEHADTGWEHYADGWEILGPDGKVLAKRVLRHPHVDEQPFTRELAGVAIPQEITVVTVRAHDSVQGYGGKRVEVRLERPSSPQQQ
jgi:hypothetical protein